MFVGKRNEFGLKKALYKLPCSRPRSIKISPKSEAKRVKAKKAKRLFQRKMTVRLPSPQLVLLCSLVIVAVLFQETDAWGRFRLRRVVSTPRIHLPRIRLPRIRLPRIRLPRLSLPRVSLPRIRISKGRILPHIRVSWRHGRDSGGNSGTATPPSIDPCSVIVTKSEWGAPSLKPSQSLTLPMSLVAVYACGKSCSTREACIQVAK
ncbi:hypothetical protein LSH36_729g01001 [Paralvinella palmiformis]|uniref:Uncharacterized protein n=1 Tax=Paralvinella palmiformis TaxID=53620 RepID=A0AAD9MUY9_9ANNE|nr:hypothetical protein LSH36_729g01001 [Paralvinella palmiformis]